MTPLIGVYPYKASVPPTRITYTAHEAVDADIRLQVQERLDVKEKDHEFRFTYGGDGDSIDEQVRLIYRYSISICDVTPKSHWSRGVSLPQLVELPFNDLSFAYKMPVYK